MLTTNNMNLFNVLRAQRVIVYRTYLLIRKFLVDHVDV